MFVNAVVVAALGYGARGPCDLAHANDLGHGVAVTRTHRAAVLPAFLPGAKTNRWLVKTVGQFQV